MADKSLPSKVKRAVHNGDLEELQHLLGPDIDVDLRLTASGKTALILAAREGHLSIVRFLVDRGADVLAHDDEGRTALMRACEGGYIEIAVYLVHRGADILQWNVWGKTPLLVAAHFGHWHIVQFLVGSGADTEGCSIDGKSALHVAIERGHAKVVSLLVDCGCSMHSLLKCGRSGLQWAACGRSLDVVDVLLAAGANQTDFLCIASAAGNILVVQHLLGLGCNCNAMDAAGWSPAMYACSADHFRVVVCLVTAGAQLRVSNDDGESALSVATGVCRIHLENNTAIRQLNSLEERLIEALRYSAADDVLNMLEEDTINGGAPIDDERKDKLDAGNNEISVDSRLGVLFTENNHEAMLLASQRGFSTVLTALINRGGNVNSMDQSGKTCMMYAAEGGHTAAVTVLAAAGGRASIDATDRDGWSVLTFACDRGWLDVVKLVVRNYGANLGNIDLSGKAAVYYASRGKHYDVVAFLFLMRAKRALSVVCKYWSSNDVDVAAIGLTCIESVLPHGVDSDSYWQLPSAAAAVICDEAVVDSLQRLKDQGPVSCRERTESLLAVSLRYRECDIFSAIAGNDWYLVLDISNQGGCMMRDKSERAPLHHLLCRQAGTCDDVVLRMIELYPEAGAVVDPVTDLLPIVLAVRNNLSWSIINALVVAYAGGVDAVSQLQLSEQERFWATSFSIEALSSSNHKLWLNMVQLSHIIGSDAIIAKILSEYPELMYVTDSYGRSAYCIGAAINKQAMDPLLKWHGRYSVQDDVPEFIGADYVVWKANDDLQANAVGASTTVALTITANKRDFEAEILARSLKLDPVHVINVFATYPDMSCDISSLPDHVDFQVNTDRALNKKQGESAYIVATPLPDRNLCMSLRHERYAGKDFSNIKQILSKLVSVLRHIHEKGILHGDIKPLNIVRCGKEWKLTNFTAFCFLGEEMTLRRCSSAFLPPEAVCISQSGGGACVKSVTNVDTCGEKLLTAHPSFDIWSLGCVLYQLCNPNAQPLFQADIDDNLSLDRCSEDNIYSLAVWTDEYKRRKLNKILNPHAASLLSKLLSKDPADRPNFAYIMAHPFFSGTDRISRFLGKDAQYDVFLSYRARCDEPHARLLYDNLICLGARVWFEGDTATSKEFAIHSIRDALVNSQVFVCVCSRESMLALQRLQVKPQVDTVLLECRVALELKRIGLLSNTVPVLVGDTVTVNEMSVYVKFVGVDCLDERDALYIDNIESEVNCCMNYFGLGSPTFSPLSVSATMLAIMAHDSISIEGDGNTAWRLAAAKIARMFSTLPSAGECTPTTRATSLSTAEEDNNVYSGDMLGQDASTQTSESVGEDGTTALAAKIKTLQEENAALVSNFSRSRPAQPPQTTNYFVAIGVALVVSSVFGYRKYYQ